MELNLRDVDLFINKTLEDFNSTYNLAMHVILLECIKKVGLNKRSLIEDINNYTTDEVLVKLSNASFANKTYLKKFIALDTDKRKDILNSLAEIVKKCNEEDGFLIIPKQPKLIQKNEFTEEAKRSVEVNDFELGNIKIDCDDGCVTGENIKYNSNVMYNDFPIDFSVQYELEEKNLPECFENNKDLYMSNIKYLSNKMNIIENFVIEKIWKWFTMDHTEQEVRTCFVKLNIILFVKLSIEENNSIFLTAGWSFEEENDEREGYFDFIINKDNDKLEERELNYY